MALPSITFIKGQGGLGRPLAGKDHYTGLNFYCADGSLPSGFSTTARQKFLYSVADAVAAGIKNDYSDATAAIGVVNITNKGTDGDTIEIIIHDINVDCTTRSTSLGTYTKVSADNTSAAVATAIAAIINAGTINHGYSATVTSSSVNISAPKRLGTYLNADTPLQTSIVGTIAATLTQFSASPGVASKLAVYYYHISEFFRLNPKGVLCVGFYAVPGTYTFSDVTQTQNFANGDLRQIGVFVDGAAYSTSHITALDTVCKSLDALKKNISAVYHGNLTSVTDISTLADLQTLTANKVSDCIAQDGADPVNGKGGQGHYLYITNSSKSIGSIGTMLGAISLAKVNQCIGNPENFPLSNGIEYANLAFANGKQFSDVTVTETLLAALDLKRHNFIRTFSGQPNAYFVNDNTSIILSSDYAYIRDNRVIDKAIRILYTAYFPKLNSDFLLNADGTISDIAVAAFESLGSEALVQMVRDGEISSDEVTIDPTQDVKATSTLTVAVALNPKAVAKFINIPIGYN